MAGIGYYGSQYGGGNPSSGGFPEPTKPKIHTLTDTFDGPGVDGDKWDDWAAANSTIVAGQLQLTTNATAGYFGITSHANYDFQDSYVFAELVDPGNQSVIEFEAQPVCVLDGDDNGYQVVVSGGTVSAMKRNGTVFDVVASITYDSDVHKWFRITESGGVVEFWFSTIGTGWEKFAESDDTGVDTFSMYAIITVGTWGDTGSAATATFDNFNTGNLAYQISGSLELSGGVSAGQNFSRSISGTLYITGQFLGFIDPYIREDIVKTYEYKIYDPQTGDFLGRWDDVISDFAYSQEINSAGGSVDVVLARNSDSVARGLETLSDDSNDPLITDSNDEIIAETETANTVGAGTNVALNLNVEVYVYKEDDPDLLGTRIFTGFISKFVTQYGRAEQTIVTLFPHSAELDNWVLEGVGGDLGETRVTKNSMDPGQVIMDTLDQMTGDGGIPTYDTGTVELVSDYVPGYEVSYTYNVNTELEVIRKNLELAPTDWFWYYDMAQNNVHFHPRPSEPDHTFVLGKHILDLNLEQYIEELTNTVYFTGGEVSPGVNLFKKYVDTDSITDWRRGLQRITDSRVTDPVSAEIISESLINRAKEPRYRSNVRISDKVFNIESIRLGDLITFRNFGNFVDGLEMQVVRIDYTPDFVQLQLDTLLPSVPKRLEDVKRNLMAQEMRNNPDEPTP